MPNETNNKKITKNNLKDLPRIDTSTIKKLNKANISSIRTLAVSPLNLLIQEAGLSKKLAERLILIALDIEKMGFTSADKIWERRKSMIKLTTGSSNLDDLLGGGFEPGAIAELFGEYRTGKTQICHQLCVNVQLPKENGGFEGRALYLDTHNTLRPERIIQMAKYLKLDEMKALRDVIYHRVFNFDHQMRLIREVESLINEKNIKLLVLDNIMNHFEAEYQGRGILREKRNLIRRHLNDLQRLTRINPDLAVIFVNQVRDKPDVFYGNPLTHLGGHEIAHGSTTRIYLRKGKGEQRIAKVIKSPLISDEYEPNFSITDNGIMD